MFRAQRSLCRKGNWAPARCAVGNVQASPKCAMELQSKREALSPLRCSVQLVMDIVSASIDRRRHVKPLMQCIAGNRILWRNGRHHDPLRCLAKQFFRQQHSPGCCPSHGQRDNRPHQDVLGTVHRLMARSGLHHDDVAAPEIPWAKESRKIRRKTVPCSTHFAMKDEDAPLSFSEPKMKL